MAVEVKKRIVPVRRHGGEYDPSSQDRWYESIEAEFNSGVSYFAIRPVTGDHTLTSADSLVKVDASSAAVTISIPDAAANLGRRYDIKKVDSSNNAVTLDPLGSQTIDGELTCDIIFQYDNITIVSDGSNWNII